MRWLSGVELKVTRIADFDRDCCESWPLDVFLSQEIQDRHGGEISDQQLCCLMKRVFSCSRWLVTCFGPVALGQSSLGQVCRP